MAHPPRTAKNHRRSASRPPTESYAVSVTPLSEGSGFSLPSTGVGEGQAPTVSNRGP